MRETKRLTRVWVIFFGLLATLELLTAPAFSCARPPNTAAINPVVVPLEASGYMVAYQNNYFKGPITSLRRITADGLISGGTQLDASQPTSSACPTEMVPDGLGNVIITWALRAKIWAQKVSPNGDLLWPKKVAVGTFRSYNEPSYPPLQDMRSASDGAGGVVVTWLDRTDSLYVQRIDKDWKLLWPKNRWASDTVGARMNVGATGDTLFMWVLKDGSVFLQRLDPLGRNRWASPVLLGQVEHHPKMPVSFSLLNTWLIPQGADEYIVAWANTMSGGYYNEEPYPLNLKKINGSGEALWQKTLPQTKGSASSIWVVSDSLGGAFVFWRELPQSFFQGVLTNLRVQHIDSLGEATWPDSGLAFLSTLVYGGRDSDCQVISDGAGGAVVAWMALGNLFRCQRMDPDGNKLWGSDGILVSHRSFTTGSPSVVSDGQGGFVVSFGRGPLVAKLTGEGEVMWELTNSLRPALTK